MKPSERIEELSRQVLAQFEQDFGSREGFERNRGHLQTLALVQGLITYLDEQRELDRRRALVNVALATVGYGADPEIINELLVEAGVRDVAMNGDRHNDVRRGIVQAAKEAGLF